MTEPQTIQNDGMDDVPDDTFSLEEMRVQRDEWVARNFPDSPNTHSLLGMIEEVGELAHAQLKQEQGIRGTAGEHEAAAKDAIGDFIVYLWGPCSNNGINPDQVRSDYPLEDPEGFDTPHNVISGMAFHTARLDKGIRDERPTHHLEVIIGKLINLADRYCGIRGFHFEGVVSDTWNHVMQRDWQKNKQDGGTGSTDDKVHATHTAHVSVDPEEVGNPGQAERVEQ